MTQLNRLHQSDMANGNIIDAGHLNAEFNQLVSESNSQDTRTTSLESGTMDIAGVKTFTSTPKTNQIDERTAASGVTVDEVLLKDGKVKLKTGTTGSAAGDLSYAGGDYVSLYNGTNDVTLANVRWLGSSIVGLNITNNGSDANNDLDISAGRCLDATSIDMLVLPSALTKRTDATWVAGTNQGGWDTGSKAADDNMHIWLIKNPTTGVVDILFSDNASPTMPSGFTLKRLAHILKLDGSGNIRPHIHEGNTIIYKSPIADFTTSAQSTTPISYSLTVPAGYVLQPLGTFNIGHASTSTSILIYSPDQSGGTPAFTSGDFYIDNGSDGVGIPAYLRTNTARQITIDASAASTIIRWRTHGYTWHGREIL